MPAHAITAIPIEIGKDAVHGKACIPLDARQQIANPRVPREGFQQKLRVKIRAAFIGHPRGQSRLLHDATNGTSAKLVNIVHDEVIVEVDAGEADSAALLLEKAMVSAGEQYVSKVPVKVDVKIANEWVK